MKLNTGHQTLEHLEKTYRRGTHRVLAPEQTLQNIEPLKDLAGITRVANVTGLDRIGIPVVMVTRPNSRSISVSQGKGLTLTAAKVSGLMEAIEGFVAETVPLELARAPIGDTGCRQRTVNVTRLPRHGAEVPGAQVEIEWCRGKDLITGDELWAPAELIHTNYTLPQPEGNGWFYASSNGLASGNSAAEALVHALCEVIERDCRTRWMEIEAARIGTRIDPSTIVDEGIQGLLELLESACFVYGIWNLTNAIGLPAFVCAIGEGDNPQRLSARTDAGSGCHPCREVALTRAITEAAQMRLTYLSGARDDQGHEAFVTPASIDRGLATRAHRSGRDFNEIVSFDTDTAEADVFLIVERLRGCGYNEIYYNEFPVAEVFRMTEDAIAVVRVIVPGLVGPPESYSRHLMGSNRIL